MKKKKKLILHQYTQKINKKNKKIQATLTTLKRVLYEVRKNRLQLRVNRAGKK